MEPYSYTNGDNLESENVQFDINSFKSKQGTNHLNEMDYGTYNYVKPTQVNETQPFMSDQINSEMNLDLEQIEIQSGVNFGEKVNSDYINSTLDKNRYAEENDLSKFENNDSINKINARSGLYCIFTIYLK
jgi:hypothetical protein